jgi:DNA-binding MarR family transcriptional regulator
VVVHVADGLAVADGPNPGGGRVQLAPGLRGAGRPALLDTEDTTISALARRCGVTRQAASQQIALLDREGYVTRKPDPADSRAVMVGRTPRGEALLRDALEIVADIEADYAAHLGRERMAELKALLADLLGHADPEGRLGSGN